MALTPEDQLRIHVLLQNQPQAVRIEEGSMTFFGLTPEGTASIPLHPDVGNERYLKHVREMLSAHVLGSPGGYPVYLKRWTRMGQTSGGRMADLLLLGEPEAVMAVANAQELDLELATRTWWAATNAEAQPEVARHLLRHTAVRDAPLGEEVAHFLLEYLPFLEAPQVVLVTASLILQDELLGEAQVMGLWNRARNKSAIQVAFLQARAERLPELPPPHRFAQEYAALIEAGVEQQNVLAMRLRWLWSPQGQGFVQLAERALNKVSDEDLVYPLLEAIGGWFAHRARTLHRDIDSLQAAAHAGLQGDAAQAIVQQAPELESMVAAVALLGEVTESICFRGILHSGAVGSQLRRKMKTEAEPILEALRQVQV
jgi:hypothetical protein